MDIHMKNNYKSTCVYL